MRRLVVFLGALALIAPWILISPDIPASKSDTRKGMRMPVVGNADVLQAQYESWKSQMKAGWGETFVIDLATIRGLTPNELKPVASGRVTLDLAAQTIEAELGGVPLEESYDLWLVGRTDKGGSMRPTDDTPMLRLGNFMVLEGRPFLRRPMAGQLPETFFIDQIMVAKTGENPREASFLFGVPTFFQRLYALELQKTREADHTCSIGLAVLASWLVPMQSGGVPTGFGTVFFDEVTEGEDLFFNETFKGNGRTCGTCHPAAANFTLNAADIAELPNSDPLFVAEFVPELILGTKENAITGGLRFENPVLMRTFGLILENVDGFGTPGPATDKFVMRGIPHTIGMSQSILNPAANANQVPLQRTGWGGDGAPSGVVGDLKTFGRLLDFAVGAVVQHFTLATRRTIGVDFVLPTTDQLMAMEAFQLSIGRQAELNLATMSLKNADADTGRQLFRLGPGQAGGNTLTCNNCHFNAGANDSIPGLNNFNFNTGIELFLDQRPDGTGEPRPIDGGFGNGAPGAFTLCAQPGGAAFPHPKSAQGFGNRSFNTASVIESADTLPAFHNNIINTLEETITFYNTPEFAQSFFCGAAIPFNTVTEVPKIAAFMRVINALDNIDNSAVRLAKKAIIALSSSPLDNDVINRLLSLAVSDCQDSVQVLLESNIHRDARNQLKHAEQRFEQAMNTNKPASVRIAKINEGLQDLAAARAFMIN